MLFRVWILFQLLTFPLSVWSQDANDTLGEDNKKQSRAAPWQIIFQLDNDLFAGDDRNYTNGIRLGFVQELQEDSRVNRFLHKQLLYLLDATENTGFGGRLLNKKDLRFASGVGLTQLMFTPDDPELSFAPRGERPYAGWLGLEFSLHAKNADRVNSVTISIGTTGSSSMAREAQEWVHENISDSPIYQGWDSQVPSHPTINLHFDHKKRLYQLESIARGVIGVDGYYEWGGALGNFQTNLYGGTLYRIGFNLPPIYSIPRVQLGSYGHQLFDASQSSREFSALIFGGVRATAVAHDITIDGPMFGDFDTGVESKILVGEAIVGFGLRYMMADLSFSQVVRSDEFYGQNKNQRFGSVNLRFNSHFERKKSLQGVPLLPKRRDSMWSRMPKFILVSPTMPWKALFITID